MPLTFSLASNATASVQVASMVGVGFSCGNCRSNCPSLLSSTSGLISLPSHLTRHDNMWIPLYFLHVPSVLRVLPLKQPSSTMASMKHLLFCLTCWAWCAWSRITLTWRKLHRHHRCSNQHFSTNLLSFLKSLLNTSPPNPTSTRNFS